MRVVIGGPPHSGKSTFTAALIEHIRERTRGQSFNISFEWMTLDITDNSLRYLLDETGEVNKKRDVAWTNENAQKRADEFISKSCQLVIADAPGKLTEQLDIVIDPADQMILLVSNEKSDEAEAWQNRAANLGLNVPYRVTSFIAADADVTISKKDDGSIEGSIKSVSRDDFEAQGTHAYDDHSRRVIRLIATQLLKQAAKNP